MDLRSFSSSVSLPIYQPLWHKLDNAYGQMRVQAPEVAVCSPECTYLLYVGLIFTSYYPGSLVINANPEISVIPFYKLYGIFGLDDGSNSYYINI